MITSIILCCFLSSNSSRKPLSYPDALLGTFCYCSFYYSETVQQLDAKLIPPQLQNQPMAGRINRRANRIMP